MYVIARWKMVVYNDTGLIIEGRSYMASSCDMCAHYVYDEEDDFYECLVNMDEDDFARFIARGYDNCPYFQLDDEYKIVRHQM